MLAVPPHPFDFMPAIDIFVLISGSISVFAVVPLIYLAVGAVTDAHDLRLIQHELAGLMRETKELGEEVRELQQEIRRDQQAARTGIEETRRTVEQVTEAVEHVGSAVEHVSETVQQVHRGPPKQRARLLRRLVPLGAARQD